MSYLTKNGPNNRNSNFDLQRMEEERKKKELERHNEEEKRRKGEQTKKDSTILQSRITNKKRILESTKVEIKRLEREADEIDPKIRHLKEEIERFKNVSESNSLKTNAEKRRLSEIKIRNDDKKKE